MINKNITKRCLVTIFTAGISASMLVGCGTSSAVEVEGYNNSHFANGTENFVVESGKLISQSPFEIDPENVADGYYDVEIDKSGINEFDGYITIKAEVYKEDTYDAADINSAAEGDAIYVMGEIVPINSIEWEDSDCLHINGGTDNDGITLSSFGHPDYFRYRGHYEMDRSYSHIETINLEVSGDVKLMDSYDPSEDTKEYTGDDAISALKEIVEETPLSYYAGAITVKNGVIVEIYRNYTS